MKTTFHQYAIYHEGKKTPFEIVARNSEDALRKAKVWTRSLKVEVVNIEDEKDRA